MEELGQRPHRYAVACGNREASHFRNQLVRFWAESEHCALGNIVICNGVREAAMWAASLHNLDANLTCRLPFMGNRPNV
jgi:hypothetical protein